MQAIDRAALRVLGTGDRSWLVPAALAEEVRLLSETYTRQRDALVHERAALQRESSFRAARLRFFLPRDLPKIEPVVHEVWRKIGPPKTTLRVLDLGAGYGTTSLGVVRAWLRQQTPGADQSILSETVSETGSQAVIEIDAWDRDAFALKAFSALADEVAATLGVTLRVSTHQGDFVPARTLISGQYDLVLFGLSLNELGFEAERAESFLHQWMRQVKPDGALIVIEPGLRETSRVMQDVAQRLQSSERIRILGPCPKAPTCPLLTRPRDWCHQDLDLPLPEPLETVAKQAGLRYSGLSFSYLSLTHPSAKAPDTDDSELRIVGGPIETKGQTEWHGCSTQGLVTLRRNLRDRATHPQLDGVRRGDQVKLGSVPNMQLRIGRDAEVVSVERFLVVRTS